jgi:hypothetical protein
VPWAAVRAIARTELRARWRSLLVVGLLAGLVAGVVGAAGAVARRTATAYDRLAAATHLDDARVLIFSDNVRPEEIERLPGVEKAWRSSQVIGQVLGRQVLYVSVSSGPPRPDDLFSPVIVSGRQPRDDSPYEVIVPDVQAREVGLHVGDRLPVKLLTPLEVTQFDTGFGAPDGPRLPLRVVGIFRTSRYWIGNGIGPMIGSPALREAARGSFVGQDVVLRLADGPAGVPRLAKALDVLSERAVSGDTGREFGVLQASYPTAFGDPDERAARHTLATGLLVLLGVALVGGLLAVALALARHHAAGAADQLLEAELGLTRAERVLARLLPALLGALVAAVVAGTVTATAGAVQPLGPLRAFEPRPGYLLPAGALLATIALTAVAFLALAGATAARVVRSPVTARARGGALGSLPRLSRRPAALAGLAFALRNPHGRAPVPVRATAAVTVLGVAGVVAVASFAASLDRLVDSPERYGWVADFGIIDSKPEDTAALAADPRIRSVVVADGSDLRLDGQRVFGASLRTAVGPPPITVLDGRLPERPGEVALGLVDQRKLKVGVGDPVTMTTWTGGRRGERTLTVVGSVVLPDLNEEPLGTGALVSSSDLRAAARGERFSNTLVQVAPGVDAGRMYGELAQRLEMVPAGRPPQIGNLAALGRLPAVLAAFLALLALVVLAHALVLTARRRSPDLAVLRVIGLTPRQVAAVMGVMAATIAVIGVLLGPVLGLAVGRVVWAEVAAAVGVAGDLAMPWWVLALVAPVALVASVLVAVLPARRAARLSPARVLRAE